MRHQRARLVVHVDNLLELVGAAAGVYGLYRLEGLAWALILAAVLLVVAAEFIYDGHAQAIPLPHRPRPVTTAKRLCLRARASVSRPVRGLTHRLGGRP